MPSVTASFLHCRKATAVKGAYTEQVRATYLIQSGTFAPKILDLPVSNVFMERTVPNCHSYNGRNANAIPPCLPRLIQVVRRQADNARAPPVEPKDLVRKTDNPPALYVSELRATPWARTLRNKLGARFLVELRLQRRNAPRALLRKAHVLGAGWVLRGGVRGGLRGERAMHVRGVGERAVYAELRARGGAGWDRLSEGSGTVVWRRQEGVDEVAAECSRHPMTVKNGLKIQGGRGTGTRRGAGRRPLCVVGVVEGTEHGFEAREKLVAKRGNVTPGVHPVLEGL